MTSFSDLTQSDKILLFNRELQRLSLVSESFSGSVHPAYTLAAGLLQNEIAVLTIALLTNVDEVESVSTYRLRRNTDDLCKEILISLADESEITTIIAARAAVAQQLIVTCDLFV